MDKNGKLHEKIYDVVWGDADKRKPDSKGKLPAVGSTVDVANATWTNTISYRIGQSRMKRWAHPCR